MAKNTITEDDLLAGVGGAGTFGQFGSGKPIRDNPFRETRRELLPSLVQGIQNKEAEEVDPIKIAEIANRSLGKTAIEIPQRQIEVKVTGIEKLPKKKLKADLYSEKMSTFLSSFMRDELTSRARRLNSNRLVKGDPISQHSLLRCGVRVVTELIQFSEADVISSEEELYALIRKKVKG